MSNNHGDEQSPYVKLVTTITTIAKRENGQEEELNQVIVDHRQVEHLTGLNSDFLEGLIRRTSPAKRAASPTGAQGSRKSPILTRPRTSARTSPVTIQLGSQASPQQLVFPSQAAATAATTARRQAIVLATTIQLTGGVKVLTTCPGATRTPGTRQILGFVELDLVNGVYQGDIRFSPGTYRNLTRISSTSNLLESDDCIDWERFVDPGDLAKLSDIDENKVSTRTTNLLQQLRTETEAKPDMNLVYHVGQIVEAYLTRGRHADQTRYHILVKFLKECAPVGMSINNLGFKMIFNLPERKKDTLAKLEALRILARPGARP